MVNEFLDNSQVRTPGTFQITDRFCDFDCAFQQGLRASVMTQTRECDALRSERFSEKGLLTTSLQDSGRLSRYALGLGGMTLRQQRTRPSIIDLRRRRSILQLKKQMTCDVEVFLCLAVLVSLKEKRTQIQLHASESEFVSSLLIVEARSRIFDERTV